MDHYEFYCGSAELGHRLLGKVTAILTSGRVLFLHRCKLLWTTHNGRTCTDIRAAGLLLV